MYSSKMKNSNNNNKSMRIFSKNKKIILLITGMALSNLTFHFFSFALPIIIYNLANSVFAMSTMRAIQFIPNLFLGIFIGVIVDRSSRKKIIRNSAVIQLLSIFFIILLLVTKSLSVWHLYFIGIFLYTASYAMGNAYHTIIPTIIDKEMLTSANAKISFLNTFSNIIGPSLAGILFAYTNEITNLSVTMIGFFILISLLFFVKVDKKEDVPYQLNKGNKSFKSDFNEGWKQLVHNKSVWSLTLIILIINIASSLTGAVLIFYALSNVGITKSQLGIVVAGTAVGGLISALIAKKLKNKLSRGKLFLSGIFLMLISHIIMYFSSNWIIMFMAMFIIGISTTQINIHYLALRQESTPNHLLGRVAGTSSMIMKMAVPVSYLFAGILGEIIPISYIFLLSAVVIIFVFLKGIQNRLYLIK
uniref:MFS transporter n=1 Tax=Bacillus sp. DX2.2 TaxID=3073452 RepID=UPI00402ABAA6